MGKNKIYNKYYKSKRLRALFIEEFKEELTACGEELLPGTTDEEIFNVFKEQGYWSGVQFNIRYYEDGGFEYEERKFGKWNILN